MESSAAFYYLTDGLGSTMALADQAGDVDTTWYSGVCGAVRGHEEAPATSEGLPAS